MNCITLEGSCYEMGLRQGTALLERGERVLEQVPFPITPERVEFAEACLPVYARWFHGALEELEGIAEGQDCAFRMLAGASSEKNKYEILSNSELVCYLLL